MKLRELGEFGLIDRIAMKVKNRPGVELGIGDDAAAVAPTPGTVTLITSDMLVEGIHFDLAFCDLVSLGRKSLSVNLSDVAAMGAVPTSFLLSLAIPPTVTVDDIEQFSTGLFQRAEEFGVTLVGGDTCASRGGLVISITLLGEQQSKLVVKRNGAKPGDLVCLTGTVGDSALGLQLLRQGIRGGNAVERHLDPVPRVREGIALAESGLLTSMIDVSDGVLADLGHILDQSAVGAEIQIDDLPVTEGFRETCRNIGCEPVDLALSGGEDYELLFTICPDSRNRIEQILSRHGLRFTVVGRITESRGLSLVTADGSHYTAGRKGFDHFA